MGLVIKIDFEAIDKGFGTWVKALVEMDLREERVEELVLETRVGNSVVGVKYIDLPLFCGICDMVGHGTHNCPKNHDNDEVSSSDEELLGADKGVNKGADSDGFQTPGKKKKKNRKGRNKGGKGKTKGFKMGGGNGGPKIYNNGGKKNLRTDNVGGTDNGK